MPPQQSDRHLLEFLRSVDRPVLVVGTKSDRLSGNQLRNALHGLEQEYPGIRILPFSSKSGAGREKLWEEIRLALDAAKSSQT